MQVSSSSDSSLVRSVTCLLQSDVYRFIDPVLDHDPYMAMYGQPLRLCAEIGSTNIYSVYICVPHNRGDLEVVRAWIKRSIHGGKLEQFILASSPLVRSVCL